VARAAVGASLDRFDERSTFVVARVNGELAGMIRLTVAEDGPLENWALDEPFRLPTGKDVIEFTRGVVRKRFRGQGVFRELLSNAVSHCASAGFCHATAAVQFNSPQLSVLVSIGFQTLPASVYEYAPQTTERLLNLVCDLRGLRHQHAD
jgi:GNAT superfamily N-acetyltransferase